MIPSFITTFQTGIRRTIQAIPERCRIGVSCAVSSRSAS